MTCSRFRIQPMKRWEAMLTFHGGDPQVDGRDAANPNYQEWMRRFGHRKDNPDGPELADTPMPHGAVVFLCGATKVDLCAYGECEYPAECLCDYPVGGGRTCDLLLCRQHGVQQRPGVHLCPIHHAQTAVPVSGGYKLELVDTRRKGR